MRLRAGAQVWVPGRAADRKGSRVTLKARGPCLCVRVVRCSRDEYGAHISLVERADTPGELLEARANGRANEEE